MNLLQDPRSLNYLLLGIYFLNSIRWAVARDTGQSLYWFSAMLLTCSITFFRR